MMTFKPLTETAEWEWVKGLTHVIACEDSQGIVAVDRNGSIAAIAVFDSFTVDACNVHMAIGNPFVIRSGFLSEIGRHLFYTCGRKRLFGLVPSNNPKALKMNKHIGFHEVARVPDAVAEGIDYIVMRMDYKDACRWIDPLEEAA